jgi:hypothetical protein
MRDAAPLLSRSARIVGAGIDLLLTGTFLVAFFSITFLGGGGCKDIVIFLLPPLTGLATLVTEGLAWGLGRLAGERPSLHRSHLLTLVAAAVLGALGLASFAFHRLPGDLVGAAVTGGGGLAMMLLVIASLWRVVSFLHTLWAWSGAGRAILPGCDPLP